MSIQPVDMAEGEARLPYFFTHGSGNAVLCPDCAQTAPDPQQLKARYTASRAYRCVSCLIWIGPINVEEEES